MLALGPPPAGSGARFPVSKEVCGTLETGPDGRVDKLCSDFLGTRRSEGVPTLVPAVLMSLQVALCLPSQSLAV